MFCRYIQMEYCPNDTLRDAIDKRVGGVVGIGFSI
jgi:hypothetical protein